MILVYCIQWHQDHFTSTYSNEYCSCKFCFQVWRESLWWSRNLLHPDYCILQSLLLRLGYQHKVDDEESSIFKWLPLSSRFMVTATSNLAGFSSLTRLMSIPISIYLWYCPIYCKVLLNLISYYCVYCTGSPRLLDHQDLSCLHRHKIL